MAAPKVISGIDAVPLGEPVRVDTDLLQLDPHNPRLITSAHDMHNDDAVIRELHDEGELSELLQSIASNGYLDFEPLVVTLVKPSDKRLTVLEGNRRLAAIRVLTDPKLATRLSITAPEVSASLAPSLKAVRVIRVGNRADARPFIAFKHINGPHRWESYAKAKFAADWYAAEKKRGEAGLSLTDIAERIGDNHDTIKRMVAAISAQPVRYTEATRASWGLERCAALHGRYLAMKKKKVDESQVVRRLNHFTPLRYPGGKGKLAAFVKDLMHRNELLDGEYVEPYAGGAAIALELLLQEYVSHIHINDISRPIYAFWKCVLNNTDRLVQLIQDTPLTVRAWDKQKRVLANPEDHDDLALGFATFFLNRTNRSGILNGGIIGGRDQSGPWKIDARFNAPELIHRIESIAKLRTRISLSKEDAKKFLLKRLSIFPEKTLIYLDPPYYIKGKELYYDYYTHQDHEEVAKLVKAKIRRQKWIVSYDNIGSIRDMYEDCRSIVYGVGYSARDARDGAEIMFFCKGLEVPPLTGAMWSLRKRAA